MIANMGFTPPVQHLLVATAGAAEPLVASVLSLQPQRILFLCSADSKRSVDRLCEILSALKEPLQPGRFDLIPIQDPQDLEHCVEVIYRHVSPVVATWSARGPEFATVADFTGGTKAMSVALGLVSRTWNCSLQYIGGTERTQGGIGVVVSGKEQIVHRRNPWDTLGYQTAEDAATLFDRGNPAAASLVLETALPLTTGPVNRGLAALRQLVDIYACWDRFDHASALRNLKNALENQNHLHHIFSAAQILAITAAVTSHRPALAALQAADSITWELVRDLVSNAARRINEGRFDDAVARLYRAIEATAQWRLSSQWQIETGKVALSALPEKLRARWVGKASNGNLKLGLQDAYGVLFELGDELGTRFREQGFYFEGHGRGASMLRNRNDSILAHGCHAVGEKVARGLLTAMCELTALGKSDLFEFPQLSIRQG
jgi:CRISPR-associated protein (TIGR02710 family)